ncbi:MULTISPECIES: hypothetical protein [Vibrio]|uniref:hypothetical protein n=1 Tax=Vibrio TaxID=662 RepID=UPI000570CC12|nr:hypothetical protein [Vibrio pacinii]
MSDWLVRGVVKATQWLIFIPSLMCFSYVLRPILMLVLIPGGLVFLAVIGGKEVRAELVKMLQRIL